MLILHDIVHAIVQKEVSALTPRMDLSPRTRVYTQGGRRVSYLLEFWPVWSGTSLQIPIERFLDHSRLMCWLSYLGYQSDMWRISHLLGSAICPNLWQDLWDPGGACLSPMYTSHKQFSKSRHLAIVRLSWLMALTITNEAIRYETSGKKPYPSRQKIDRLDEMSRKRCKNRFQSERHNIVESRRWIN